MLSGESCADMTNAEIDVGKQSISLNLQVGVFDDDSRVNEAS
jgi:hypothetical protein